MRNIVIIYCSWETDISWITLNGKQISLVDNHNSLARGLGQLFDAMNFTQGKPLVYEICREDYFTYAQIEQIWNRNGVSDIIFLEDEIDVLRKTGDVDLFVQKVQNNLKEVDE